MNEVFGGWLYVGNWGAARSKQALQEAGIRRVFSCLGPAFPEDKLDGVEYHSVHFDDDEREELNLMIDEVVEFLRASKMQNTLVHCAAGQSRSVALVIAYLIIDFGHGYDSALAYIKEGRPSVCPNYGFEAQLRELERRVHSAHDPAPLRAHLIVSKAEGPCLVE